MEVECGLFRQPKDLFSRHGKKAITMAKIILQLFCRKLWHLFQLQATADLVQEFNESFKTKGFLRVFVGWPTISLLWEPRAISNIIIGNLVSKQLIKKLKIVSNPTKADWIVRFYYPEVKDNTTSCGWGDIIYWRLTKLLYMFYRYSRLY